MAEQPSPKRRIIKRAAIAVAIPVLLFWLYVSSYFTILWAHGRGVVPFSIARKLEVTIYAPLECYMDDGRPGSQTAKRLRKWVRYHGAGQPIEWHKIGKDGRVNND